ncbi:hypothetical protein [Yersinia pestis]|nr:hypothetical protein [Yersinia pestis]
MLHNGIYPPLPVCYYLSTLWAGNSIFIDESQLLLATIAVSDK